MSAPDYTWKRSVVCDRVSIAGTERPSENSPVTGRPAGPRPNRDHRSCPNTRPYRTNVEVVWCAGRNRRWAGFGGYRDQPGSPSNGCETKKYPVTFRVRHTSSLQLLCSRDRKLKLGMLV